VQLGVERAISHLGMTGAWDGSSASLALAIIIIASAAMSFVSFWAFCAFDALVENRCCQCGLQLLKAGLLVCARCVGALVRAPPCHHESAIMLPAWTTVLGVARKYIASIWYMMPEQKLAERLWI
jgi:hypothetical protein